MAQTIKAEEMKILVVEDNTADFRLLEQVLKKPGNGSMKLLYENCLEGALKKISEEEIDAILLDLSLPESTGLDTLAQIQEADSVTPVIVLTGTDDEELALRALRLGAQDYLIKDRVKGESLARVLRYSIERNRFGLLRKVDILKDEIIPSPNSSYKRIPKSFAETNCDDLAEILEHEKVKVHFQPWVSLKKMAIVGVEGLCRGEEKDGSLISPTALLRMAGRWKLLGDLDCLFRKKVVEQFSSFGRQNPDLVLSVNFDVSVLNDDENYLDDFPDLIHEHRLNPSRIAIEILESHTRDLSRLRQFIESHRAYGFLIALDDVGSGYSSLERIAELKPDLIKTDRSLLMGIDQSYHKQEVFKSMVKLAHSIGALVVAEGAETEMETLWALELGSDMIQGFYFSRPEKMQEGFLHSCEEKIDDVAKNLKRSLIRNINAKRTHYREYDKMIADMGKTLTSATPRTFDSKLTEILLPYPQVQCLFILDEGGTQLSRLVAAPPALLHWHKALFRPTERGSNHSLKDYYYYLMESDLKEYTFVTEPHLSLSTGLMCVTISTLFKDAYGRTNVLCVDVKPE